MSRHSERFVTLVTALFMISIVMADRSVHPSSMLDLVDAFNLTAIDLKDLDLEALFPDGIPTQEPPVYPSHPDNLFEVLPPVVNQHPVQTPVIPTLKATTEEQYTTKTAENQHRESSSSSSTTEEHSEDDSTNEPSYESDVIVPESEGLEYETTQSEARETVVYELITPSVMKSMPTTRQKPATQHEVKSTTQYETILSTMHDTQPAIEYETNPPVVHETNPPISYETNSPTRYEPSPPSPSTRYERSTPSLPTRYQTSPVSKQQTTESVQAYPTTTSMFVRMTDPREFTAYTPRYTYSTSLGYDDASVSVRPTKAQTRRSPYPTRPTKKVSQRQTKPIPSRFESTIRSFTKAKRPSFGQKLGHGAIREKASTDRPQRKGDAPSSHSKLTYNGVTRRRNTKRPISKQPTLKWVKIPSSRPPTTTPSRYYIGEYKPIKIMHHRNPHKNRYRSTPLARTTTKSVVPMKEAPATTELIVPYNSHSNPKLQTTTPNYEVNTGRGPITLHSKPSFEISMKVNQQMNPELMSHLFDEKTTVDYLEQQPTTITTTTEHQTTREVISTHRPTQTTTAIKEQAYHRPATKLPHPSWSTDKKRFPARRRPSGSYRPMVPLTKEPSYHRPSTVKAVAHPSSTKRPTRYRPQKLKPVLNLLAVAGGSSNKNYATSYVIPNNNYRKHSANRS